MSGRPLALLLAYVSLAPWGVAQTDNKGRPKEPPGGTWAALNPDRPKDRDAKRVTITYHHGVIKSVDVAGNTLVLVQDDGKGECRVKLEEATQLVYWGPTPAVKLTDLKAGMQAAVLLHSGELRAYQVSVYWPTMRAEFKSASRETGKLVVKGETGQGYEAEMTLPIADGGTVHVGKVPADFTDLSPGRAVEVRFALDKKTVVDVNAVPETDELMAWVHEVEGKGPSLLLLVPNDNSTSNLNMLNQHMLYLSLPVATDCKVRQAGKAASVGDLEAGDLVLCRFAADRRTISSILASEPRKSRR